ncbi:MAG: sulfatase-like hydrolase/transferase [Verrucomicrobia subdivision 3 bacterium]|nr:sulfatase-like hydrolase/transferase [Limisphaerales bacterium]
MPHTTILFSLALAWTALADQRPNVLFCFSDDWGRYASIYRDEARPGMNDVIHTPTLDAIGRSGVVFNNAFVSAPSCTPSRAAVVTGMPFYRCGSNAFLRSREYGPAHDPYKALPGFSELLVKNGYHVMHWGKTTNKNAGRRDRHLELPINHFSQAVSAANDPQARKREIFSFVRANFRKFLDNNADDKPFFYWFGPHNLHRQWTRGSAKAIWGLDPDSLKGKVPAFLPDVPEVREDLADYLGEALAWDGMVHELIAELKARGEFDNTLVIVSGDHGMPGMPRGKCNLHDFGSSVSLLVSWPDQVKPGRRVDDFVSLMDIAPTVLEATNSKRPDHMIARSFMPLLKSAKSGVIDTTRDHVIIGRERHVGEARRDRAPYPSRAIRTADFLLIRNFKPDRMPMGEVFKPEATVEHLLQDHYLAYPDMDASPTKVFLMTHRDAYTKHFDIAFSPRPEFELYDLKRDPDQIQNVAADPQYATTLRVLTKRMMNTLRETGDPRVIGDGGTFDRKPYVDPTFVPPPKKRKVLKF